jgi:peptidyl-tRNA hydrolase
MKATIHHFGQVLERIRRSGTSKGQFGFKSGANVVELSHGYAGCRLGVKRRRQTQKEGKGRDGDEVKY